jgi:DNA mismatch endonuclease, patch repair protein
MTDNLTPEQRKKNMQAIRSQSQLENLFTTELWKKGYRFRKNVRSLYGKPDVAIKKYKIVIFIDSCFWHCCPLHGNKPKSNLEYWNKKLARNIQRDLEVNDYYLKRNWNIKRIWEHEIKNDLIKSITDVAFFIDQIKQDYPKVTKQIRTDS